MTALADACADLAAWLPAATALLAEPDADGARGGGKPGSTPPWNQGAANAKYDAKALVRDTEAMFRLVVTGRAGRQRPWSDASTLKALEAIGRLGDAVPPGHADRAARDLAAATTAILRLPAIDEAEKPQRVPWPCPYCGFAMVRVFPRAGRVACLRGGAACTDADGSAPCGQVGRSQLDGSAQIIWADGLVT